MPAGSRRARRGGEPGDGAVGLEALSPRLQRAACRLVAKPPLKTCRQAFLGCLQEIGAPEPAAGSKACFAYMDGNEDADDEEAVLSHVCQELCRSDAPRESEEYLQAVRSRFQAVFGAELGHTLYATMEMLRPGMLLAERDGAQAQAGEEDPDVEEEVGTDTAHDLATPYAVRLRTALDAAKNYGEERKAQPHADARLERKAQPHADARLAPSRCSNLR